ncbi:MAG: hypothetical protein ACYS6W_17920, partial [Planctomycetota bacterium]
MQDNYLKDKLVVIVLLGVSAFLGIMILVKVRGFLVDSTWAENAIKGAVAQTKPDANNVENYLAKFKTIADELKKKNLFAPPPPKKHPVSQVSGILGDEVLINGKWYKVGDKVGDAKIVAIESTQVRIEWQGKEKIFAPISAASAPEPEKVVEKAVVKEKTEHKKIAAPVEKPVEAKVAAAPVEADPLAWMGVELSPKVRKMLLQHWNKGSDEEKEKAKEEWNKMSDEQKQQALDAMEQMPDSIS